MTIARRADVDRLVTVEPLDKNLLGDKVTNPVKTLIEDILIAKSVKFPN